MAIYLSNSASNIQSSSSISTKTHKILGGIENAGNTCFVALVLQDLASEEKFYKPMLQTKLVKKPEESEKDYKCRENLQNALKIALSKIKNGETVDKNSVTTLYDTLLKAGWQESKPSIWFRILHWLSPEFFPHPPGDTFQLYNSICMILDQHDYSYEGKDSFFKNWPSEGERLLTSKNIVHLDASSEFSKIETCLRANAHKALWKIKTSLSKNYALAETIQGKNGRSSQLKQLHIIDKGLFGNHVKIYRKLGDQWFCCDDANVQKVASLPTKGILRVVYESK